MRCQPRILLDHPPRRPKISVILLDWGVRESFHSLHYLNQQTVPRDDYELIWLEFYDHEPDALHQAVASMGKQGRPALDRWVVMGYPREVIYHKHRLYNVGLLASHGHICVICDSDAMFTPTFIERLIRAFEETPRGIVHLDQIRNNSHRFYPFNYPAFEDVSGHECINWHGWTTSGLIIEHDRLHRANMGACLAARRQDCLAIGGADEHLDYLGYMCGPYDLTFRLSNYHGEHERWLFDEYLYHTWHPNTSGVNSDYHGPEDGRLMAIRALEARSSFRIEPYLRSPILTPAWCRRPPDLDKVLSVLADREETSWCAGNAPTGWPDEVYWALRNHNGFNLFCHRGAWFALPMGEGRFDPVRYQAGDYPLVVTADSCLDLEGKTVLLPNPQPMPPEGGLSRLLWKLRQQPLGELPSRLWRNARRVADRVGSSRAPWLKRTP